MSFFEKITKGFRSLVLGLDPLSPDESRDSPRILCQYRVNMMVAGKSYKVSIVDIGTTGMRLEEVPNLPKGTKIALSFPFADEFSPEDAVQAEVMWCRPSSNTEALGAGVRYSNDEEELRKSWVHTLLTEIGLTGSAVYQKRKHVRLATTQKAFLRDDSSGKHILEGRVNNISLGGALVESAFSMKRGRRVLALIGPTASSPTLSIRAKVISSRTDVDEGSHLLSLQFVELTRTQLSALESLVVAMLEGRTLA